MEQVIRKTLVRGTEAGSLGGIVLYSLAASVCSSCAHPRLVVIAPWLCITSKVKEGQELPVLPFLFFCNQSYPAACRVILPGALLKAIFPVERDWLWLYRLWQRRGQRPHFGAAFPGPALGTAVRSTTSPQDSSATPCHPQEQGRVSSAGTCPTLPPTRRGSVQHSSIRLPCQLGCGTRTFLQPLGECSRVSCVPVHRGGSPSPQGMGTWRDRADAPPQGCRTLLQVCQLQDAKKRVKTMLGERLLPAELPEIQEQVIPQPSHLASTARSSH